MPFVKKNYVLILEFIFFSVILLLSIVPLRDYDIWFHLKSGEIIAKLGVIHYDVFSYNTVGREWFPYEWLFQVIIYYFSKFFGFEAIKFLIATIMTTMMLVLYTILRKIFKVHWLFGMFLVFFFFTSINEFLAARPHIFAYTFLLTNLFLIFVYFFKKKNLLLLTIPITLMWANLHGSIFLDVGLFGGYAFVSLFYYFMDKNKEWLTKFKTLSLFTIITAILTILPPLYFTQYRLLWIFFKDGDLISKFIDEWTPLISNQYAFIFFTTTVTIITALFIFTVVKKKAWKEILWVIPLSPFPVMSFTASRNVFLGYISLTIILAWVLSFINPFRLKIVPKIALFAILAVIIAGHIYILNTKRAPLRFYYPVQATQFIKDNHIKGHMFNEYGYGGYMLYHLYPEELVFFDGRTDLYLDREIPDTLNIALKKDLPDEEYSKFLYNLWNKYKISYVVIKTQGHAVDRKIGTILLDDPNWSLVFWDDNAQIFIRHDGMNDNLIKKYKFVAATPYDQNPYRTRTRDQALLEYERMITIADSSKSRNEIGFILLQRGKLTEAKEEFIKAVGLDPYNESPLMNLAEMSVSEGNLSYAAQLYLKAMDINPQRGLIYIRLGQIYQMAGDINDAKKAWQTGLEKTPDLQSRQKLSQLLEEL